MKTNHLVQKVRFLALLTSATLFLAAGTASASVAYGTINNFDAVNDTGVP